MSMTEWLDVLKLKKLPSFSDIHELEDDDFEALYFRDDPQLVGFIDNLLENLQGDYPSGALRIQAAPGWGKTSFFFYLERFLNERSSTRFIYIFNANELANQTGVEKDNIERECLNALIEYTSACCDDKTETEYIINHKDLSDKTKVNRLVDFIRKNPPRFSKRLVAILDGVDLLSQELALETAIALFHLFQSSQIIKWLAIRDTTFGTYSEIVKDQIATLFPGLYCLPSLSLYEIAQLRIWHAGGDKSIMPFSKKLCLQIQRLSAGDHRQGLATLFEISQTCPTLNIRDISPDRIRSHFERSSTTVFLRRELVPNLFGPDINPNPLIPLTKEVMALIYYRKRIDDIFMRLLNESFEDKLVALGVRERTNVRIIKKDVNDAAMKLSRIGLIIFHNIENITVTEKGHAVREYIEQEFYINECRVMLKNIVTDKFFWDIATLQSGYRVMLMRRFFATVVDKD